MYLSDALFSPYRLLGLGLPLHFAGSKPPVGSRARGSFPKLPSCRFARFRLAYSLPQRIHFLPAHLVSGTAFSFPASSLSVLGFALDFFFFYLAY